MSEKTKQVVNWNRFLRDIFIDILIIVFLFFGVRFFLFAPFRVHGPSMCPTFNIVEEECQNGNGEYLLTSRFPSWAIFNWSPGDVKRGDILIFDSPYGEGGNYLIKRVIGLPGDTLRIQDGFVYIDVNGDWIELDETYLSEENSGHTYPFRSNDETYEVPEGHYFMMGDNRLKSSDSRRCFRQLGCDGESSHFINRSHIEGEVKLVLFPFSEFRWVKMTDYDL